MPHALSSPALALLLVFRTNVSYARWLEARSLWGRIINNSRGIVRTLAAWYPAHLKDDPEQMRKVARVARLTASFSRTAQLTLQRTIVDETCFSQEAFADSLMARTNLGLKQSEADFIAGSTPNRPLAALAELSQAVYDATESLPFSDRKLTDVDARVVELGDCLGACERIYGTPVPLVYTRHTARFLAVWLLLVPLALAGSLDSHASFVDSLSIIPESAVIATFLFGIDELAVQLEEPFSILALEAMADGIDAALVQLLRPRPANLMSTDQLSRPQAPPAAATVNGEPAVAASGGNPFASSPPWLK